MERITPVDALPRIGMALLPQQLRRVMKLTTLFTIVLYAHISAKGFSQTVSFSGKNVPLQTVFSSFEKQTGVSFFFNYELLKDAKPVSMEVRNISLEKALDEALRDEGLDFYQQGKTVFIIRRLIGPANKGSVIVKSDQKVIDVKGKVINHQGEGLAGATVTVKNSRKGTLTDAKGYFELKEIEVGAMLEVSYLGYQRKAIEVVITDEINIELSLANNRLDEVQVIAYGQTSERFNIGNVGIIKAEEIEKQPVNNVLLALEGRVPGLFVAQSTGLPGSGVSVRVQGQNSILKGNDPLYVVDGVPYISQNLSTNLDNILGTSGSSTSGNPLSFINPSDIESISVLKDADATAIYGSRAANGAILITTKKGASGQTKIDLNLQNGWGRMNRRLHMLNTPEYITMRREAIKNDGLQVLPTDYDINGIWDSTRYTDLQKVLLGGTSQYTDLQGNVSGGNANTQYLIGGGYHRETTVFPGGGADQKGSVHVSINSHSDNHKFHIQLSVDYLVDNNQLPNKDFTTLAVGQALPPNSPAIFKSDGSLNWAPNAAGTATWANPYAFFYRRFNSLTNNLISNAVISYRIIPGLEIKSDFGYTNLQNNETTTLPAVASDPSLYIALGNSLRSANYANNVNRSWIIEPQLSYYKNIGKWKMQALLGSTILQNNSLGQVYSGTSYNSDLVLADIKSAANVSFGTSINSVYKYNAGFGRINFNWDDKYLIDLTARRDGSSRFGSQNQFHNFEAIGFGWVFSNEEFINRALPLLSFGKIRGSYGTTGNDQIGDYSFLNLYVPVTVGIPYQGATGLSVNNLPNPYLKWEETTKMQGGIDLGLFKDRIILTTNYFRNRSSNQLLNYALPYTTGFTSITQNFPAKVQNTGWEFVLSSLNFKRKSLNWNTSINLTIPQNKLISFSNLATSSYSSLYVIGKPVTSVKVFHFLGVDPATGINTFADSHGGATTNPSTTTDKIRIISLAPRFYGGLTNSISYKGITLDFLLQFVKQLGTNYVFGNDPGFKFVNQPISVFKRWRNSGDITTVQKFNSNDNLYTQTGDIIFSDAYYSDASYIRLKNASLSYQFPEKVKSKSHLKNLRVYVQGQNLFTITRYRGLDPENKTALALPPLSVLTTGINITF
jgi:TonB-linked SusC/RagA family outer membrane protein